MVSYQCISFLRDWIKMLERQEDAVSIKGADKGRNSEVLRLMRIVLSVPEV